METLTSSSEATAEQMNKKNENAPYNNNAHLFKKGVSGNPLGRPKGVVSLKTTLTRLLNEKDAKEIGQMLIDMAKQGDLKAIELLCKLRNEFVDTNVNIQLNQISDSQIIERARQFAQLTSGSIEITNEPIPEVIP